VYKATYGVYHLSLVDDGQAVVLHEQLTGSDQTAHEIAVCS